MTISLPNALPITRPSGCPFDPPERLGQLRESEPIARMRFADDHLGWVVTGHALARQVLADPRFSSRGELRHLPIDIQRFKGLRLPPVPRGMFIQMDAPEHSHYRKLLTGQFTVRRMNQLVPRIEQIAEEHLEAMARKGPPAELVHDYALAIPSLVICELLGVPYAERGVFHERTKLMMNLETGAEEAMAAFGEIMGYLSELIDRKRTEPADDLLSGLVTGGELDQEELVSFAVLLLTAGHETTANMLALGAFALLRNPAQLKALQAEPELVDSAVEELLRYLTITHFGLQRAALEDVEIGGVQVRKGEALVLHTPTANRDPAKFEHPDELDLHRHASGHLAFGHGVHQCLGQQLARVEMRIGFRKLFERFPTLRLAVPAEEVPMRTKMGIYGVHSLPVTWES
ncbi:cytochrome P450 [Crossiella cryophila]|uniref:Cytochrome P450 n=1 Tax=Crossiella cryophila TaxID=43355 RepID=A0A7W7CHK7_9PSEU|nr:cytochrome P450 [Crossiella cryophila]MBB4681359.1 cytochrome P450 [Crossiella cryophila]